LFRDGQPLEVVHGQTATVKLASQHSYVFTVRALDSAGYLSAPAPNLTVVTTHTPPSVPGGLAAATVTYNSAVLTWSPSTAVSGRIVGYRVFRDGIPVGQTATPGLTLSSLAPSSIYQVTVVAVDSLGAISAPTPALAVQTAPPTQTHGTAQAFLLASTDQSFYDLEAHYQQLGVVYPTYFDCGPGGEVTGVNDPLVTSWSEARGIAVMPRLNCQNPVDENQILNEPAAGQSMINRLAALCATYGYQGIQIDFEGAQPSERNPFTAFITALATRLHAQGDKISTIVTAKYYNIMSGRAAMYDDAALSVPSDYVFVLDWGLHWTTSGPGGMDELPWFKRVAEYTATLPNRGKFVLGMPMYGIDWPGGGGSGNPGTPLEFNNITALESEYGIAPEWSAEAADPHFSYVDANHVQHSVWYTDQQSVGVRVALADSLGLGVGLWHLGSEDQSIWELPGLGG
jgi:spore germination protein YaaH